jgi:hypothetical protein
VRALRCRYTNVTAAVELAESLGRPLLTYSWEPREHLMDPLRFVRISMRDFYYCSRTSENAGHLNSSQRMGILAVQAARCCAPFAALRRPLHGFASPLPARCRTA